MVAAVSMARPASPAPTKYHRRIDSPRCAQHPTSQRPGVAQACNVRVGSCGHPSDIGRIEPTMQTGFYISDGRRFIATVRLRSASTVVLETRKAPAAAVQKRHPRGQGVAPTARQRWVVSGLIVQAGIRFCEAHLAYFPSIIFWKLASLHTHSRSGRHVRPLVSYPADRLVSFAM